MKICKKTLSVILVIMMLISTMICAGISASAASVSQVYFDNSVYNWENVYIYAYGTKENAKWPGQLMEKCDNGLYFKEFSSVFANENIIFNNGLEEEEGKEQYPENSGLPLKTGQCCTLTADNSWIDYGKADSNAYGYAFTPTGTSFTDDYIEVKLGVKNADKATYSIDGAKAVSYKDGTVIKVGEGKIGNSTITLTLTATGENGTKTTQTYSYKKTFTPSKSSITTIGDGHTTEAEGGYYGTNPDLQLGKNKTITIDGKVTDWDSSMIIAQGTANDDPRVYMPSSMHEQPWDGYALYSAWDNDNLYFMFEMTNTTYITSPSDNFAASNEARPWRNSIPMYIALSVDPDKHATGKAYGTNKNGTTFTNECVWGCRDGKAVDGGFSFTTNVDTLVVFDSNNSNGGASIFKADVMDTDGSYMFNYDTAIPIGVTSFEKQDNRNGFKIKYANGSASNHIYGVNGAKGSRKLGDNLNPSSKWVDFKDLGYKSNYSYIYEIAIPLANLGIDKDYIENTGIGAMQILTYGTSAMDTLPHDPSVLDNANKAYGPDPSTSKEKEDMDNITVPLARIGNVGKNNSVSYAKREANFGADKSSQQTVGTKINLKSEFYNTNGEQSTGRIKINDKEYPFSTTGSSFSVDWTPTEAGTYNIELTVDKTANHDEIKKSFSYVIFDPAEGILKGDVNGDGVVNIEDAKDLQKFICKLNKIIDENEPVQFMTADFDGSEKIDIKDATLIQKSLAE